MFGTIMKSTLHFISLWILYNSGGFILQQIRAYENIHVKERNQLPGWMQFRPVDESGSVTLH